MKLIDCLFYTKIDWLVSDLVRLKKFCKHFGTKIVVLSEDEKSQSLEEELAEDIVSIIHSFSGKLYGMRRKKVKNEIDEVLKDG